MKRIVPLLLATCAALPAAAEDDFGIWTGVSVEKSITKKLSADVSLGFRAEDKLQRVARWDIGAGVGYKPLKWLSIGAGYTYIYGRNGQETKTDYKNKLDDEGNPIFNGYNVDHGFWRNRHRATFDVTGKLSAGRWTFALRERYQYTHYAATSTLRDRYRSEIPAAQLASYTGDVYEWDGHSFARFTQTDNDKKAKDRHTLRSRLTVEYNIRHYPLTPYVSAELYNNFSENMDLDKSRFMAGVEWKISKRHRLDFAYLFQNSSDDDNDGNLHAINIEYKFKF